MDPRDPSGAADTAAEPTVAVPDPRPGERPALPEFTVEISHNERLPPGGRRVEAVVSVTARRRADVRRRGPDAAEVIILDSSSSMDYPKERLTEARRAAATAIDTLRDGVAFAVIAGTARARMVYPAEPRLVPATERSRAEAKAALAELSTEAGTAIGAWLSLANILFEGHDRAIKHAILLTDGHDEHESAEDLRAALAECEGRFTCDCRGIGDGWVVNELRTISSALLGTTMRIREPEDLAADFRRMTQASMSKAIDGVSLRVWAPVGATVTLLRQETPEEADLTDRRRQVSAGVGDYPLGAWGEESRDYQLVIEADGEAGDEMLAARVAVVVQGARAVEDRVVAQGRVHIRWTATEAEAAAARPEVEHYARQAELGRLMRDGADALLARDGATAVRALGAALALATELGDDRAVQIATLVEVVDPATGRVRLRDRLELADVMDTQLASVRTRPLGLGSSRKAASRDEAAGAAAAGLPSGGSARPRVPTVPGRYRLAHTAHTAPSSAALPDRCPSCDLARTGLYCEQCGHRFDDRLPA